MTIWFHLDFSEAQRKGKLAEALKSNLFYSQPIMQQEHCTFNLQDYKAGPTQKKLFQGWKMNFLNFILILEGSCFVSQDVGSICFTNLLMNSSPGCTWWGKYMKSEKQWFYGYKVHIIIKNNNTVESPRQGPPPSQHGWAIPPPPQGRPADPRRQRHLGRRAALGATRPPLSAARGLQHLTCSGCIWHTISI
jgi:hypothetical protein